MMTTFSRDKRMCAVEGLFVRHKGWAKKQFVIFASRLHPLLNLKVLEIVHYSCGFELSDRTNPT